MPITIDKILDRLERAFLKERKRWKEKPPPQWLARHLHDLHLQPCEMYSWRLYLRVATPPGVAVAILVALAAILPIVAIFAQYPKIFLSHGMGHKLIIGFMSRQGVYTIPYLLLFLLMFNYLLYLPRRFLWNRRAARLQRKPGNTAITVTELISDESVWPPAPISPPV